MCKSISTCWLTLFIAMGGCVHKMEEDSSSGPSSDQCSSGGVCSHQAPATYTVKFSLGSDSKPAFTDWIRDAKRVQSDYQDHPNIDVVSHSAVEQLMGSQNHANSAHDTVAIYQLKNGAWSDVENGVLTLDAGASASSRIDRTLQLLRDRMNQPNSVLALRSYDAGKASESGDFVFLSKEGSGYMFHLMEQAKGAPSFWPSP